MSTIILLLALFFLVSTILVMFAVALSSQIGHDEEEVEEIHVFGIEDIQITEVRF